VDPEATPNASTEHPVLTTDVLMTVRGIRDFTMTLNRVSDQLAHDEQGAGGR
jgi:hypothetical protein